MLSPTGSCREKGVIASDGFRSSRMHALEIEGEVSTVVDRDNAARARAALHQRWLPIPADRRSSRCDAGCGPSVARTVSNRADPVEKLLLQRVRCRSESTVHQQMPAARIKFAPHRAPPRLALPPPLALSSLLRRRAVSGPRSRRTPCRCEAPSGPGRSRASRSVPPTPRP